jgi:hypothetical protein
MLTSRLPQRRSRRRWTAHAALPASVLAADVATARGIFTLALAARGVIEVIDALGHPWVGLVRTVLLTVLALGLFTAARRSCEHRGLWLFSVPVAAGLAIASFYDLIGAAITPAGPAVILVVCIVLVLVTTRDAGRHRRH